ncbi:MAG: mRNA surveillance protein pelota [Candidatus Ranarchaeia archaeon]|jgi:protein pelota
MRILRKDLAHGQIKVAIDSTEDLWHLYNVIFVGDLVYARSFRRIKLEDTNRPDKGERRKISLGIKVDDINFHEFSDALRVKGTIIESSDENCPLGSYHTFNFTQGETVRIVKENWPRYTLKRIDRAVQDTLHPKLIIVAIEADKAQVSLLSNAGIRHGPVFDGNLPGKRYKTKNREKLADKFFQEITTYISTLVDTNNPQKVIIVGPGLTHEYFTEYLKRTNPDWSSLIVQGHASSGTVQGVYEVLKSETLKKELDVLDIKHETNLMNEFLKRVGKNQTNVAYGFDEVFKAVKLGAVADLLLLEDMLRASELTKRKQLDNLLLTTERNQGKITMVNSNHPSGKQLKALGGIVALLRYNLSY